MYEAETEAVLREDIAATQEIRDAFAAYFAGNTLATVPYAMGAGGVERQTVAKAIDYIINDDAPFAALQAVLQGGDVQRLRDELTSGYINANAADVAQQRAAWDNYGMPDFVMQGALA